MVYWKKNTGTSFSPVKIYMILIKTQKVANAPTCFMVCVVFSECKLLKHLKLKKQIQIFNLCFFVRGTQEKTKVQHKVSIASLLSPSLK